MLPDAPRSEAARLAARSRILLGIAVLAVFSVPLLVGQRYGGLDHSLVHLGIQCALRDGDGVALDWAMGGGSPLLAEPQSGVFYPLTWLLWPVRDPELAASLWSVAHLGVAAWAAALLGARSGLERSAALAFGVAHVASGTVLNLVLHGAYLAGAAWTPLVWAGAVGTFGSRRAPLAPVEVAAGLGLLLLAGELQGFAIAVALVLVEAARARPERAALLRGAGAVALGLLLGMAQWVPTFGLRDAIARSGGLSLEDQTAWSLGMPELLGAVWPGVTPVRFSSGATLFHLWTGTAETRVPWNPTPYVGLGALALGLGAAWRSREARWWALGAALLLVMALGANTPVYGLVQTLVPPVGLFRYPAKYFAPASLALLLASVHVLQRPPGKASTGALAVVGALSLGGLAWVVAQGADLQALSDAQTFGVRTLPGVRPEPVGLLLQRGLQATAMVGLLGLVWWRAPKAAPWVLAADLLLAAPLHLEGVDPVLAFEAPRAALGDARTTLLCTDPSFPSSRLDAPDRDWGLAGVTLVQLMQHKANLHQCGGPAVPQHYLSSAQAPTVSLWHRWLPQPDTQVQAAVALGCTHLSTREVVHGERVPDETPPGIAPPVVALEHPGDAVVVPEPRLHETAAEAVDAAMVEQSHTGVLRHLDDPAGAWTGGPLPPAAGGVTVGEASITTVSLEGDARGVVVLRRPWWPGWHAEQAGAAVPVLRAAGVRLAVVLERPGPVTLTYRPPLLGVGLGLGGLGWMGLLGWAWAARRRGERP